MQGEYRLVEKKSDNYIIHPKNFKKYTPDIVVIDVLIVLLIYSTSET